MANMSIRHPLLAAALTIGLLCIGSPSAPAAAGAPADPCALLFVPQGYQLRCTVYRESEDDWRLVIRPERSLFAPLSELTIEPVDEPIEDPRAWLRDQLRIDLSGLEHVVRELAESEDSPFAGEEVGASLESWLGMMTMLTEWPLQSCEEPSAENGGTPGETSELACEWEFGPFHQHLVLRLVERDGQRYGVRVRTMNERRLRHLVAIANSL
jgi:hypothetical protein